MLHPLFGRGRGEPGARGAQRLPPVVNRGPQGGAQPVAEVVQPQMIVLDRGRRHQQPQPAAGMSEFLAGALHRTRPGIAQAGGGLPEAFGRRQVVARNQLGRTTRRLGAHIGRIVAQRCVDLVAHAGDDRHAALRHGAHKRFLIEGPQILRTATAAADDQQVENLKRLGGVERRRQFGGRALALHLGGQHDEPARPTAPGEDADEILHGGPGRRRDETDRARQQRDGLLARGIEETLGGEPLLELLQFLLEPAGAMLDERAHHQLILAAGLVDADFTIGQHLQSVAQRHTLPRGIAPEEHAAELGAGVLERKIHMPAGLGAEIGNFTAHPTGPEAALQEFLHPAGELSDAGHATHVIQRQFRRVFSHSVSAPNGVRP